jgi:hypothetical protein
MRIYGIDFTSRPCRRKPITCAACMLAGDDLRFETLETFADFAAFDDFLAQPGQWIAGLDFPFAHARKFVEGMGWPTIWAEYAGQLDSLSRKDYRAALEAYKAPRPAGDREHPRGFEAGSGAASPQKLYGVPVSLMLFEGAPRLWRAGVDIPALRVGDPLRQVVEAYPGVLARRLGGSQSYKSDDRRKATPERAAVRRQILDKLRADPAGNTLGVKVWAPNWLADDPGGDPLDALLCAAQAAWAARNVLPHPERLAGLDPLEGWIADPWTFRSKG